MHIEECRFTVGDETLAATKVFAAEDRPPSVISFHGHGTTATRLRIRYVLDHLAVHGISSACFDFSGNGESTGELHRSSLRKRQAEALAATELMGLEAGASLIGTSMGGFLATLLAPLVKPRSLILFCPTAYAEDAMDLPLDDDFPGLARRPRAYRGSPAFRAIALFKGNLLVVAAGNDAVVEREVIEMYANSATMARSVKVFTVERSDHKVHPWLSVHQADRASVLREIVAVTAGHA